jgi:F-type H+-transporting ATPase subunit a
MEHGFTWFSFFPQTHAIPIHVLMALTVSGILFLIALYVNKQFRPLEANIVPPPRTSIRNFVEMILESLFGLMRDLIGEGYERFIPIIATLAFFILISNLLGLIPGLLPPTDNLNTTLACAVIVFLLTHYYGFKEHGIKYLKHFAGPVWWLAPLMFPVELISHFARPISLSIRLFGNIFADHMVLAIILGLAPLIVPLPVMALGLVVAIVQTLIFVVLSIVYFALAIEHEEAH